MQHSQIKKKKILQQDTISLSSCTGLWVLTTQMFMLFKSWLDKLEHRVLKTLFVYCDTHQTSSRFGEKVRMCYLN